MIPRTRLLPRTAYVRDARIFVVAVEGEREERWYFEGLRDLGWVPSQRVKLILLPAEAGSSLSAPEHVRNRLQAWLDEHQTSIDVDQRWLVVDVDRHHNLQAVLNEAHRLGWSFAVSNPCFEVWLQLHGGAAAGTDSASAKAAWTSWRSGRPEWPFTREDVDGACTRAAAHPAADQWIPAPPPATGVHKLVRALLNAR
jgi:hypothetical protein